MGDLALCAVAACMRDAVRRSDIVCRYGGEDVLILLPGCDIDAAAGCAETIRIGIETLREFGGDALPSVTASLGQCAG
jgi:diguanylate cyclase (GGDEF)-like protein